MIKAMKFVSIPVRDQQRALEFYTTKLGFRIITDQPFNDEQRWIELGVGRSGSGVTLSPLPVTKNGSERSPASRSWRTT
ncbi:MAG: hypothetical protein QOE77_4115 [Blastocatellia bacterium]|jgi:catechol 2,3-dioxygenase-like lactoylglutathione lyase family enzyme|nr:hypothetical protein [Blastocatellia bacterium]